MNMTPTVVQLDIFSDFLLSIGSAFHRWSAGRWENLLPRARGNVQLAKCLGDRLQKSRQSGEEVRVWVGLGNCLRVSVACFASKDGSTAAWKTENLNENRTFCELLAQQIFWTRVETTITCSSHAYTRRTVMSCPCFFLFPQVRYKGKKLDSIKTSWFRKQRRAQLLEVCVQTVA